MKFLVVRFSAIGDCVMAAHAATSVRAAHPAAFLAWAIEERCAPVADSGRLLDLKHEFPRVRWKRTAWSPATWWNVMRTYSGLRRYRFDLGVDFQGHSKTALCLYLAKPKQRIAGHATDSLARKLNPVAAGDAGAMHVVEWNLHVLRQLGDYPAVERPAMPDLNRERSEVAALLGTTAKLVTINTGAGSRDKQWPIERWMGVAERLHREGRYVAFLGGPTDPHPTGAYVDLVGKLPLGQTMAAVAMSELHLAGDTGTGHIAAAYDIPVVSVFGPTHPPRYRPFSPRATVLREASATTSVSVEQVTTAALEWLGL